MTKIIKKQNGENHAAVTESAYWMLQATLIQNIFSIDALKLHYWCPETKISEKNVQ